MNINVLLAGNDERYIKRLAEIMKMKSPKTGDTLKIALFTDGGKLRTMLSEKNTENRKSRFHIALIDEDIDAEALELGNIPVVISLTDESDRDGGLYAFAHGTKVVNIYKYQRVSSIIDKMILEFARKREIDKKGSATACAFFSPSGGSGTSTIAAAYAVAAAKAGVKPLYISFEYFNSTDLFFSNNLSTNEGLYDIFCIIADNGGVVATIDAIKCKDKSGVEFIKKFTMWTEVAQIKPSDIEIFIEAARASHDIGVVILDLGCACAQFTEKAMECVDELFVVADTHRSSQLKMDVLFGDKTFFIRNHLDKASIIYNKVTERKVMEDFGVKSVTYVQRVSGNVTSDILETASGDLRGLIHRE